MRNSFFYNLRHCLYIIAGIFMDKPTGPAILRATAWLSLQVASFLWLSYKLYLYTRPRAEAAFQACVEWATAIYHSWVPSESNFSASSNGGLEVDVIVAYLGSELGMTCVGAVVINMITSGLAAKRPRDALAAEAWFKTIFVLWGAALMFAIQISIHVPESPIVYGQLYISESLVAIKLFMVASSLFVLLLPSHYARGDNWRPFEFPVLPLLANLCLVVLVEANSLVVVCLCMTAGQWILHRIVHHDAVAPSSVRASLRGVGVGTLSSGLVWCGSFFIYHVVKGVTYEGIGRYLQGPLCDSERVVLSIGVLLIVLGFLCGLFTFPSQRLVSKTYEESSLQLLAFYVLPVKTALFATLIRMLAGPFYALSSFWIPVVVCLSLLAATYSALAATRAPKTLDLVGYTSIARIALLLVLFALAGRVVFHIHTLNIIYYAVAFGGFFLVFAGIRKAEGTPLTELSDFRGLWHSEPDFAAILAVSLLPLAGLTKASFFLMDGLVIIVSKSPYAPIIFFVLTVVALTFIGCYVRLVATLWFKAREYVTLDSWLTAWQKELLLFLALFLVIAPDLTEGVLAGLEPMCGLSRYN